MDNDLYKTPEAPLLRDTGSGETMNAGFMIRLVAMIIDTILILLITIPLSYMVYGEAYFESDSLSLGTADFLINYVFPFIVVILFWKYKSATPGKMMCGLKIVDSITRQKPSNGQFIGRYFAYILSAIPLCIGYFWVIWDKKKQAWHDKLSSTQVVKFK